MIYKVLSSVIFFLLFFSTISVAQKTLSNEETQNFYKLIKQTKEYKTVKERTDSANQAMDESQAPQEINMEILKGESNAAPDDFIFYAALERRLPIGISLDRYTFQYDKRKKQIVSIRHDKTKYKLE